MSCEWTTTHMIKLYNSMDVMSGVLVPHYLIHHKRGQKCYCYYYLNYCTMSPVSTSYLYYNHAVQPNTAIHWLCQVCSKNNKVWYDSANTVLCRLHQFHQWRQLKVHALLLLETTPSQASAHLPVPYMKTTVALWRIRRTNCYEILWTLSTHQSANLTLIGIGAALMF